MESSVVVAVVAGLAGAAAILLLVTVVLVVRRRRSRADFQAQLASVRAENDDLRRRLDELTGPEVAGSEVARPEPADFVITHMGEPDPAPQTVPDRLVLSATLGVPLVKAAAFTHGVRRALSAESRNRIWFEMRREVRTARRQRRQLRKHLEREYRARLRATDGAVVDGPVVGDPA